MVDFQPFPIADFRGGAFTARAPWRAPKDTWASLENCTMRHGRVEVRRGTEKFGRLLLQATQVEPDPATWAFGFTVSSTPLAEQTLTLTFSTTAGDVVLKDVRTDTAGFGELVDITGNVPPAPGENKIGGVDYTTGLIGVIMPGGVTTTSDITATWSIEDPGSNITGIYEFRDYALSGLTTTLAFTQEDAFRFNEATQIWDPIYAEDAGGSPATFGMGENDRLVFGAFQNVLLFTWGDAVWKYEAGASPAEVQELALSATGIGGTVVISKVSQILVDRDRVLYGDVYDDASGADAHRPQRVWRTNVNSYDLFATELEYNDAPTDKRLVTWGHAGPVIVVGFDGNESYEYKYTGGRTPYEWTRRSGFRGCDSRTGLCELERTVLMGSLVAFTESDGRDVVDVDDQIPDESRVVDPGVMSRAYAHVVDEADEAWILFPDDDETSRSRIVTMNYDERAWGVHNLDFTCLGNRTQQVSQTQAFVPWDDVGTFLTGDPLMTWNENTLVPNDTALVTGFPVVLGGGRGSQVWRVNSGTTDDGMQIVAEARTQWLEFFPEMRSRLGWLDCVIGKVAGATGKVRVRVFKDWESTHFAEQELDVVPGLETTRLRFGVNQIASVFAIEVRLTNLSGQTLDALEPWVAQVGRAREVA